MYLDPGFGGMLVQVIVALVATSGVALFAFRKKLSNLFAKNKKSISDDISQKKHNSNSEQENDIVDMMDD